MRNPYAVAMSKLANLQKSLDGDVAATPAMRSLIQIMHEFIRFAGEREQQREKVGA